MTKKLWEKKGWANLDSSIEQFEIGSIKTHPDNELVVADVLGSLSHAQMLKKIGILNSLELKKLKKGLLKILDLKNKGKFSLDVGEEDIHTKIENFLTKNYGEVGKRIHTARSRNDQVLTATRIYSKIELLKVVEFVLSLCQTLFKFAKKHEFVAMPGYTHVQKAMPSSVGLWSSSFSESLLDDLKILKVAYELNDQSPLGSAASYGVLLQIDRKYASDLLSFSKVQNNVLYAQNSRGKIGANIIFAFCQIMETLSKMASDIVLFSTSEFGFFKVSDRHITGSSIMPQKKNIDVMELVRGRAHLMYGYLHQVLGIISGLPSGYNRDTKETKKILMSSFDLIKSVLGVSNLVVKNMKVNKEKLKESITAELFATDYALKLVSEKGVPFRKAYKIVGENLGSIPKFDPIKNIKSKKHVGATGNLGLKKLAYSIKKERVYWGSKDTKFNKKINDLLNI